MSDPKKQIFSEQEVAKILRRATEIAESRNASAYTPGVTREELERIAHEVGIDPAVLEDAIAAKDDVESRKKFLSLVTEAEFVLDGELDPNDYDRVFPDSALGGKGGLVQVGRSAGFHRAIALSLTRLSVESRLGRTKIKMRSNPFFAGLLTLYPALVGTIITLAEAPASAQGIVAPALLAGWAAVTAAFVGLSQWSANRTVEYTKETRDRVQEEIEEGRNRLARATDSAPVSAQSAEQELRERS